MKITRNVFQGVAAIAFYVVLVYVGARLIDLDNVQETMADAGLFAPLLFILLKISTIVFAPLSGAPIYFAAAPLFGFTPAFIYLTIGDILGYSIAFMISRIFGRGVMRKLLGDKQLARADSVLQRMGTWQGFAVVRVVFFPFADPISYGAGLTPLPLWQFVLVSLPMVLLNIGFLTGVGHALIDDATSYVIVIGAFILISLLFLLVKYLAGGKDGQNSEHDKGET